VSSASGELAWPELQPIYADTGPDEHIGAIFIMSQFTNLLTRIAAAALRIGFLVRGGATIGKLYHARASSLAKP